MALTDLLASFTLPHILVGGVALTAFWIGALSPKGRPLHRSAGRVHLLAMVAIIITGIPLTALVYFNGHSVSAVFLGYLLVLVGFNSLVAWRAIRQKRDAATFFRPGFLALAVLTGLAGLAAVIMGIIASAPILIAFGTVGPIMAWQMIRAANHPNPPRWWLRQHIGATIGNGIASHIAFFQIGLSRFLSGFDAAIVLQLAWFGPLVVGILAATWMTRRYVGTRQA